MCQILSQTKRFCIVAVVDTIKTAVPVTIKGNNPNASRAFVASATASCSAYTLAHDRLIASFKIHQHETSGWGMSDDKKKTTTSLAKQCDRAMLMCGLAHTHTHQM